MSCTHCVEGSRLAGRRLETSARLVMVHSGLAGDGHVTACGPHGTLEKCSLPMLIGPRLDRYSLWKGEQTAATSGWVATHTGLGSSPAYSALKGRSAPAGHRELTGKPLPRRPGVALFATEKTDYQEGSATPAAKGRPRSFNARAPRR